MGLKKSIKSCATSAFRPLLVCLGRWSPTVLFVFCLTACATSGTEPTPVARKPLQLEQALLRPCAKILPPLESDDDPVENHLRSAELYHDCRVKDDRLLDALRPYLR